MKLYSNILNSEVQLLIYESILPCFLLICIVNLSIIILLSLLNIPHPKKNSSFKNYKITFFSEVFKARHKSNPSQIVAMKKIVLTYTNDGVSYYLHYINLNYFTDRFKNIKQLLYINYILILF